MVKAKRTRLISRLVGGEVQFRGGGILKDNILGVQVLCSTSFLEQSRCKVGSGTHELENVLSVYRKLRRGSIPYSGNRDTAIASKAPAYQVRTQKQETNVAND